MPVKPTSREASRTPCVFKYEGGIECPCWGGPVFYGETDHGDKLYTCYGHDEYSLSDSASVNRERYRHERRRCTENSEALCLGRCAAGCYISGMGLQDIWRDRR